ncbi:unnamed protein product [Camellia sinensis]
MISSALEDIEHFGDVGSLDDNMDSFLSHDGGEGRDLYGTLKPGLTEHKTESSKGFSFREVGFIRTRNKVTCCHFSSDGKLLASAGHDKKSCPLEYGYTENRNHTRRTPIFDYRCTFRPNSSQLATASFDKSLRLWDAANVIVYTLSFTIIFVILAFTSRASAVHILPSYCLNAYTGHPNHVISLDFHPKKNDLFCFCDSNNEIRYWNINPFTCARVSKQGGSAQVRFQPISGHVLAAASNKVVSIFDVETDRQTHAFQI